MVLMVSLLKVPFTLAWIRIRRRPGPVMVISVPGGRGEEGETEGGGGKKTISYTDTGHSLPLEADTSQHIKVVKCITSTTSCAPRHGKCAHSGRIWH